MRVYLLLLLVPLLLTMSQISSAGNVTPIYNVTHLNTTVVINSTGDAQVSEVLTVGVSSNISIQQYNTARISLNFTISQWQALIGPLLVQHIINPRTGVSNFKLIPSPIINVTPYRHIAFITMDYEVNNVTSINQTGPRVFKYTFNDNVFNFQHATSGQVLFPGSSLTIALPSGSKIVGVSPIPDMPSGGLTRGFANVSQLTWNQGEPLSQFTLTFTNQEGLQTEVFNFFASVYKTLGAFTYVIIILAAGGFVGYTYYRAKK